MNKEIKRLRTRMHKSADGVNRAAEQYGRGSRQHNLSLEVYSDAAKAYELACLAAGRNPYATYSGE